MKNILWLLKAAIALAAFCIVINQLNYIYVTYDSWTRILFHSYYEQKNIDNLFLGSSHVFCDVNPYILDEINGENNFILGTGAQRMDDTYYLLEDAISRYDGIHNVYIECSPWILNASEIWDKTDHSLKLVDWIDDPNSSIRAWQIAYEMRPSVSWFKILFNSADQEHVIETLFPFVRYRQNLFNIDKIIQNITEKQSEYYKNYTYHQDYSSNGRDGYIEHWDKGFYFTYNIVNEEKYLAEFSQIQDYGISDKSERYLRKAIELCKNKKINIKLFISPVSDLTIQATNDYDSFTKEIYELADEYNLELYDFNLIKKDVLDIKKHSLFKDGDHLNGEGAKLFTTVLWSVLQSNQQGNENLFYDTYIETLNHAAPELYGVYFKNEDLIYELSNEKPIYAKRKYIVASSRGDMLYKISRNIKNEDGTTTKIEVIQDYDTNNTFTVPTDEHGEITIDYKYQELSGQFVVGY